MSSLMFDNRAVDEFRGSLENRKGNLMYDDLNVKQGRVLSDTRHSQGGTLAVVEVRGRCEQGDENDNVKLGRVIDVDVALHSRDCMGCAEGYTRHRSTACQGVNTDSTMNCSADEMIAQESVLEYDCSLVVVVLYNDTERCIEREIGISLDMELKTITGVEVEMSNGHDGSERERESWRVELGSVENADNAKVGLAKTEMNGDRNDASETHKYNDEKSMTWIGVWILLLITSWRMCSGEQEKYLWRVQELDLRMKHLIRRSMDCMAVKLKASANDSEESVRAKSGEYNWYETHAYWRYLSIGRVLELEFMLYVSEDFSEGLNRLDHVVLVLLVLVEKPTFLPDSILRHYQDSQSGEGPMMRQDPETDTWKSSLNRKN
eukprot:scaffold13517_cov106-Skeletonema_dohrnii-CCMP3373.AAC.1